MYLKQLAIVVILCCSPIPVAAQQPDEAGIHLLAQKLENTYGAKDLDAILALWSENSQQRSAARETTQKLLSADSAVEVHESSARPLEFDAGHARLRIDREITAVPSGDEGSTGCSQRPSIIFGRASRCIRRWAAEESRHSTW
jgi:hypothetical protein